MRKKIVLLFTLFIAFAAFSQTSKFYNDDGVLIQEGKLVNGMKIGVWKRYSYKGWLQVETEFSEGLESGKYKEYSYKDDRYDKRYLAVKGQYYKGRKVGTWYAYGDNGDLYYEKTYDDGRLENTFYPVHLFITNKTSKKIGVALHFKNLKNEWETDGYFVLEPFEKDARILSLLGSKFYYYAVSSDNKYKYKGNKNVNFNGKNIKMREGHISDEIRSSHIEYKTLTFTD